MAGQSFWRMAVGSVVALPLCVVTVAAARADDVPYTLKAGESKKINLPPNIPVLVIGANRTVGDFGAGQITILSVPKQPLQWAGYDASGFVSGSSATPDTHIIFLDTASTVDLEVDSTTSIIIHNSGTDKAQGEVTLTF
jgi:hypothetical protein